MAASRSLPWSIASRWRWGMAVFAAGFVLTSCGGGGGSGGVAGMPAGAPAPGPTPSGTGTVLVVVVDSLGGPVSRAGVTVGSRTAAGGIFVQREADRSGRVTFTDVSAGTVSASAFSLGLAGRTAELELSAGGQIEFEIVVGPLSDVPSLGAGRGNRSTRRGSC
ncbi:MAG: hypothetical protein HC809_15970 [Gammaproteobacteria bacterium]|nr:hypothetical protein [Gammaproteobacteria bacterium]